jgi:hypothetical protein
LPEQTPQFFILLKAKGTGRSRKKSAHVVKLGFLNFLWGCLFWGGLDTPLLLPAFLGIDSLAWYRMAHSHKNQKQQSSR